MPAILRYAIYIVIGYGLLVLVVFMLQRRMLYFPDGQRPAEDQVRHLGIVEWPGGGQPYRGYIGNALSGPVKGTVVAFHGNAGSAWHRYYFVQALEPLGYRVILAEYPGYGGRKGKKTEASLVADANQTITMVREQYGEPVYLLGESMGCGVVAAATATANIPPAGLLLITPWDTLPDLAQTLYWYLPARFMTLDRYDSVSNLKTFQQPIAMAIADHDDVVPNKHSLRLYDALPGPKKLWRFAAAGHNSWPTESAHPWWQAAMQFISGEHKQ